MDKYIDWLQKLEADLIEQFRGQPNIKVFQKAVARQLTELYAFFYQLYVLQWLDNANGVQLDGIGNIVDLSRTDALIWSNLAGINVPMEDDLYRKYLWFKIFLNTSEGTYRDIVRTFKMFWSDTPILYSERIDVPATMFWTLEGINPFAADNRVLDIASRVKAGGVALRFAFKGYEYEQSDYFVGAAWEHTREFFTDDSVFIVTFETDHFAGAAAEVERSMFVEDGTPIPTEATSYSAGFAAVVIREWYMEFIPLPDSATSYHGDILHEFIKEVHSE